MYLSKLQALSFRFLSLCTFNDSNLIAGQCTFCPCSSWTLHDRKFPAACPTVSLPLCDTCTLQRTLLGLGSSFRVLRARIQQLQGHSAMRENHKYSEVLWRISNQLFHPLPCQCPEPSPRLTKYSSADCHERSASSTPRSTKSSIKTISFREWPSCPNFRIYPFIGFHILDAFLLGRCAARPPRIAGAFLRVIRGTLVQLRFNDIGGFAPGESTARALGR